MKVGEIKVVGVSSYEKDGKKSYTLHGYTPFEEWENGDGYKCVTEWTNRVDLSGIKSGMVVTPVYTKGYQGKAVLCNLKIVSEK